MGFFDDDPFEELMNEFFGGMGHYGRRPSRRVIRSESEERVIDYIEEDKYIYFVFELPGFGEDDVEVKLKGDELVVLARRKNLSGLNDYLAEKLSNSVTFTKKIPARVKKGFSWTFNNGVLEVRFDKK